MHSKNPIRSLILILFLTTGYSIHGQEYSDIFEKTGGDTISFIKEEQPHGYLILATNIDSFLVVVDDNLEEVKEAHNSDLLKLSSGIRNIMIASQYNADVQFNIIITENSTALYKIFFKNDLDTNTYYRISSYPHLIAKVKSIEDLIETEKNNIISFVKPDELFGYVRINANIDSFLVIIDNNFAQYKKMHSHDYLKLPVGKRHITLASHYDNDRTFEIDVKENSVLAYTTLFRKRSFHINYFQNSSYPRLMKGVNLILISDSDSEIWLNNKKIGLSYVELDTLAREYIFKARNEYAGSKSKTIQVSQSRISVHAMYTRPDKKLARALSFIPGASQYYKGERLKGIGLFTASVFGLIMFSKYQNSFDDNYGLYLRSKDSYTRTKSETEALYLAQLSQSYYDEAQKFKKQKDVYLYATLALYLYNLIDAWIKIPYGGYREVRPIDFFNEYDPHIYKHMIGFNWPLK